MEETHTKYTKGQDSAARSISCAGRVCGHGVPALHAAQTGGLCVARRQGLGQTHASWVAPHCLVRLGHRQREGVIDCVAPEGGEAGEGRDAPCRHRSGRHQAKALVLSLQSGHFAL